MLAPDLLEPVPRLRLDARLFSETLTFAFATGSSPEAFERVLKSYNPGTSSFDPELFARDLFVKDLVARCLCESGEKRDGVFEPQVVETQVLAKASDGREELV